MQEKTRRDQLLTVPWVTWVEQAYACIGTVTGTPMREIYRKHGRPAVRFDPYRCKNPAHWEFFALPETEVRSGMYCQVHLVNRCLLADGPERDRFEEWLREHT